MTYLSIGVKSRNISSGAKPLRLSSLLFIRFPTPFCHASAEEFENTTISPNSDMYSTTFPISGRIRTGGFVNFPPL